MFCNAGYSEKLMKRLISSLVESVDILANEGLLRRTLKTEMEKNTSDSFLDSAQDVLLTFAKFEPSCGRRVHKIVCENPDIFSRQFLMQLVQNVTKHSVVRAEDFAYREMALVPSPEEFQRFLADERSFLNISPVRTTGSYASAESYIETYFNLLRYDCFFNLLVGIKKYLGGDLDLRDMNIATDGVFVGVYNSHSIAGNVIVLSCKLLDSKIKSLETSRCFMFGNLIAMSCSGLFDDIIWATVFQREQKIINGFATFYLEFAEEVNSLSFTDCLEKLIRNSRNITIAESPTHYNSYRPVLKAIQSMDPDHLPFRVELVCGQPQVNGATFMDRTTFPANLLYRPSGIQDTSDSSDESTSDSDVDLAASATVLDSSANQTINVGTYAKHGSGELPGLKCVLDESQEAAMRCVLGNRLAIVQGPPGTGKTYLGVHVANVLLSLENNTPQVESDDSSTEEEASPPSIAAPRRLIYRPILILTYKNHALDEFSKHILKTTSFSEASPGDFIRVGGRSSDEEISKFVLRNFVGRPTGTEYTLRSQAAELFQTISGKLQNFVWSCLRISHNTVLKHFDNLQLGSILLGAMRDSDFSAYFSPFLQKHGIEKISEMLFTVLINRKHQTDIEVLEFCLWQAFAAWLPNDSEVDKIDNEHFQQKLTDIKKQKLFERIEESAVIEKDDNVQDDPLEIARTLAERSQFHQGEFNKINLDEVFRFTADLAHPKCLQNLKSTKELARQANLDDLKYISDVWSLTPRERLCFLQAMLLKQGEFSSRDFQAVLAEYESIVTQLKTLEMRRDVEALQRARVIAMTVTGAAMKMDILRLVKPSVVIVEEAAEISEAHLIALLGPHVRQLILIGDHQQLRPQVECYTLVKKFNFDVSMMERLINNRLPYSTLATQNRMRPEISKYLLDIYPDLKDNPRVIMNEVPKCVESNVFFWDHDFPERSGRSKTNEGEALMALNLARYFHRVNQHPLSHITILSAYKGQTAILRKMSSELLDAGQNRELEIQTIDMFQGDENKIVIVSLVRSNPQKRIGFLSILNRRCVAQSRSKSALFFLGNLETVENAGVWKRLVTQMRDDGKVGKELVLKCTNHDDVQVRARDGNSIPLEAFCDKVCGHLMPCFLHECSKPCQPYHPEDHVRCMVKVSFTHKCGIHVDSRPCYVDESRLTCKAPCTFVFDSESCANRPCGHACVVRCGALSHDHENCMVDVKFNCPQCDIGREKKCYQDIKELICSNMVKFTYQHCGFHEGKKHCHSRIEDQVCTNTCRKLMEPCGHTCQRKCQSEHSHHRKEAMCMREVHFDCTQCGSKLTRKCHQEESEIRCDAEVAFTYPSCKRHVGKKKCHEKDDSLVCTNACGKVIRACGHQCKKRCSQPHHHSSSADCREKVTFLHKCGATLERLCNQEESTIKCSEPCVKKLEPCGHKCKNPCDPPHDHDHKIQKCDHSMTFDCPDCGNCLSRECHQEPESIVCKAIIRFKFEPCGHQGERKCHEKQAEFRCKERCEKQIEACKHTCDKICGTVHDHKLSSSCPAEVEFKHHRCNNILRKKCSEPEKSVACHHACISQLTCGHRCPKECDPVHDHSKIFCKQVVSFICSDCGTSLKKQCSEDVKSIECSGNMARDCPKCASATEGPCVNSRLTFQCQLPCNEKLQCGHSCAQKCYEVCNVKKCMPCNEERREKEKLEKQRRENEKKSQITHELNLVRSEIERFKRMPAMINQYLLGNDSEQYHRFSDIALRFIRTRSGTGAVIENVWSVTNVMATRRFLNHQLTSKDPTRRETLLWHGNISEERFKNLWERGFNEMFQKKQVKTKNKKTQHQLAGYVSFRYFSNEITQPEKLHSLLVCEVLVGKSKVINAGDSIPQTLDNSQFDSVYCKQSDYGLSYAVYHPNQINVTGFIQFRLQEASGAFKNLNFVKDLKDFTKIEMKANREIDLNNEQELLYRLAESQFYRLVQKKQNIGRWKIQSIDYFHNPELLDKFERKRKEFQKRGITSGELLSFHGTTLQNPEVIMKENFRLDKIRRTAYGFGTYFSDFPDVSLGYGNKLLIARLLPGRSYDVSTRACDGKQCRGHESHVVRPGKDTYAEMVVIQDPAQILPVFIIHLSSS